MTRKQKLRGLLRHLLGDFGAHWRPLWPLGLGGLRTGGWRLWALAPDVLLAVGGWDEVREVMEFTLLGAALRAAETKVRLASLPDVSGVGPESWHSSH